MYTALTPRPGFTPALNASAVAQLHDVESAIKASPTIIAYNPVIRAICSTVAEAVLLQQALYWTLRASRSDGVFYKSFDDWHDETGMTRSEFESARKGLARLGYLSHKNQGWPVTAHYRVHLETVLDALAGRTPIVCRYSANSRNNLKRGRPDRDADALTMQFAEDRQTDNAPSKFADIRQTAVVEDRQIADAEYRQDQFAEYRQTPKNTPNTTAQTTTTDHAAPPTADTKTEEVVVEFFAKKVGENAKQTTVPVASPPPSSTHSPTSAPPENNIEREGLPIPAPVPLPDSGRSQSAPDSTLLARLEARGVTGGGAARLIAEVTAEHIITALRAIPDPPQGVISPGGWLVSRIRSYDHQADQQTEQARKDAEQTRQDKLAADKQAHAAQAAAMVAAWEALPDDEREEVAATAYKRSCGRGEWAGMAALSTTRREIVMGAIKQIMVGREPSVTMPSKASPAPATAPPAADAQNPPAPAAAPIAALGEAVNIDGDGLLKQALLLFQGKVSGDQMGGWD